MLMWYDSKHTQILPPKEGYNLFAAQYGRYHDHLNSFEKWFFLTLLPRKTDYLDVIDLGAGDGRLYKLFQIQNIHFHRYVAFDLAEKLLSRHPSHPEVEKIIGDLEKPLSFGDNTFDLAFSFFVLEHISDIDQLFAEVERILQPWWQWIIGHFIQRREFIWKKWADNYKISFVPHRIQDLEKIAQKNVFKTHTIPIKEKGALLGHLLICEK